MQTKPKPPPSTGVLDDIRLTTVQLAPDVRDDIRAIGVSEGRNLSEQMDVVLRRYIAAFPSPPELRKRLASLKRPLPKK